MSAFAATATDWTERCPDGLEERPLAEDDASLHLWLLRGGRDDPRLRRVVARYAALEPEALQPSVGPHGKPFLDGHRLRFNLSHSGDWSLLVLGFGSELGVDLEHQRRVRRRTALLERSFTAAERARLGGAGDAGLLRYWAAKEALVKAIGRGIAYGLQQIEIGERADGALFVQSLGGPAAPASRWRVHGFDPGGDGFGVVAYEGEERPLRFFRAPD